MPSSGLRAVLVKASMLIVAAALICLGLYAIASAQETRIPKSLEGWSDAISKGASPDFGPNLRY